MAGGKREGGAAYIWHRWCFNQDRDFGLSKLTNPASLPPLHASLLSLSTSLPSPPQPPSLLLYPLSERTLPSASLFSAFLFVARSPYITHAPPHNPPTQLTTGVCFPAILSQWRSEAAC